MAFIPIRSSNPAVILQVTLIAICFLCPYNHIAIGGLLLSIHAQPTGLTTILLLFSLANEAKTTQLYW